MMITSNVLLHFSIFEVPTSKNSSKTAKLLQSVRKLSQIFVAVPQNLSHLYEFFLYHYFLEVIF